jgi:hypothetical protein
MLNLNLFTRVAAEHNEIRNIEKLNCVLIENPSYA